MLELFPGGGLVRGGEGKPGEAARQLEKHQRRRRVVKKDQEDGGCVAIPTAAGREENGSDCNGGILTRDFGGNVDDGGNRGSVSALSKLEMEAAVVVLRMGGVGGEGRERQG
ncbi:hypothetical protein PIB30_082893 [Stylosanthes scabra]|uniref:Uncharacterized protein n=1 Tax=Stylosanthes scabra TaxID=79078 RepID=A0ABU6VVR1_9FABA|nr:hypothetical protein [Stylosanthes scabra]